MSKQIVATFLLLSLFVSCASRAQKTDLSAVEFKQGMEKPGAQLLDVRTQAEYNGGHLQKAFLADWTQPGIFEERIKYLDKNKPVYTYCLVGGRSAAAAARLREMGFTEVYNLQGGITSWKKAGLPVEGLSPARPITMEEYLAGIPAGKTVLVDIGAEWCPPCKMMEPVLKEIATQKKDAVVIITIDGGMQEKLAAALNVATLPTFIIYKNGKETWRQTGVVSKEVLLQQMD